MKVITKKQLMHTPMFRLPKAWLEYPDNHVFIILDPMVKVGK